jgi:hypothetical protein
MCSGAAIADSIGIYADPAGASCSLNPTAFGLLSIYLIHDSNPGATVSKFKVNDLLGLGAPIGTSVTAGFPNIGTYTTGIEIGYTACRNGKILLGSMSYFYQLQPMSCLNHAEVVAHPASEIAGEVIYVDCGQPFGTIHTAVGGRAWGGPNSEQCGGCLPPTVATSESTWGGIKALYR